MLSLPFLTTAYPSNASSSWSILLPQLEFQNSSKFKPTTEAPNYYCRHLFGIYIMPDIFYFASYLLGLYIFRFHDGEGFYALMEKVYLQSNNQQQITRTLRIYLYLGIFWLLCSACVAILFRCIFTEHTTGSIPDSSALAQYSFIALLVIGECASNCVIVSVIISHAGQCQLLKYYLEGIMNRLEEKSTELRYIMKDILDVRQNLSRINGLLSFNAACVIFNVSVMALMGFLRFFTNPNYKGHLWIFQASFFVLWSSILAFGVIQPARLTTCGARLKDKSLAIRVFGYRTHTQLDIDSFLTFLNLVDLKATLFTIPVKPQYLWGFVLVTAQVMMVLVQMEYLAKDSAGAILLNHLESNCLKTFSILRWNLAKKKMNRFDANFHGDSTESRNSVNSSYADLLESSGVVIQEQYEGSLYGLPFGCNLVTSNLLKCKRQMIHPYYKMLSLIAWKPFATNSVRFQCFWSFINFVYPVFVICLLMVWYVARVYTCQGRLSVQVPVTPTAMPTLQPFSTTTHPSNISSNWSILVPASTIYNRSHIQTTSSVPNHCLHLLGTYILPDILYFISYLLGLYIFRFHDSEGFYALMEKVYLQSNNPQQITKTLRIYLYIGIFWLFCSAGVSVLFHHVYAMRTTTIIPDSKPFAQYGFAALLVIAECASNCIIVSVIISHAGQCRLLKFYLEGIMNRLEEKSTELRYVMKDMLDVRQNLSRINGLLSFNAACVIFNVSVMALIGFLMFFTNAQNKTDLWIYRASFFVLWSTVLAFGVIQPARLTACGATLKDKSLAIRVFGYRSHTQLDIDSFLTFLNLVDLKAKLFTIPVKPQYLWGFLVITTLVMIVLVQLGHLGKDSVWLFHSESTDSGNSANSSYADLVEASGIVIQEQYEGSLYGLPFGCNLVTSNLLKCQRQMINPYYKMLSLIAWKPFSTNSVRFQYFWSFINFVYPVFVVCLLMVWYVARVYTCQARPSVEMSAVPTTMPTLQVYLQSNNPQQITKTLSASMSVFYLHVFAISTITTIPDNKPFAQYGFAAVFVIAGCASNCIIVSVIISHAGQCQLLKYYLEGVMNRLEEKSMELRYIMKDILDVRQNLSRINGLLSLNAACVIFNISTMTLIGFLMFFSKIQSKMGLLIYWAWFFVLWSTILAFGVIQPARLTACGDNLKDKLLAIRVFGYRTHTQLDIDSFLTFLSLVDLKAKLFTIPVKPRYLWGFLVITTLVVIVLVQMGHVVKDNAWL
eukprot:gene11053-12219_t